MIYDDYYKLSDQQLLNILSKYIDVNIFWHDLFFPKHHQLASIAFFLESKNTGFILFSPVGSGKSKIVLDLCRTIMQRSCLYLCGTMVGVIEAEKQIQKHYPPCKVGTLPQKDGLFTLVAYGTLSKSNAYCVDNTRDAKAKVEQPVRINKLKIQQFIEDLGNPDVLVLDEAHVIVNNRTLIFAIIKELRKYIKYVIIMTGTPISTQILDNGVIDTRDMDIFVLLHLWNPLRFPNRYSFASEYGLVQRQTKYKSVWIATDKPKIENLLETEAVIISKDDILPIDAKPKQVLSFVYDLTPEQKVLITRGDFSRKRQIHGGFYYDKATIEVPTNKTNLVIDLCNFLISNNEKLIIIFEFLGSLQVLRKTLTGIPYAVIEADQNQSIRKDNFTRFDDDIPILLLSLGIGSMSANLQGKCRNMLFYDIPVNTRASTQADGRIDRIIGQLLRVRFFFFVSNREIKMFQRLLTGKNLIEGVING